LTFLLIYQTIKWWYKFILMENKKEVTKIPWWQPSLILFGRLSGWIAGPVILAVYLGKWLDQKYGTDPWLFLSSVGVAFGISSYGIIRDSLREMKRIEKETQKMIREEKKEKMKSLK